MYDRFIPHTIAKNLFESSTTSAQSNYQELLNCNLIQQPCPKILHFHDQDTKENSNPNRPAFLDKEASQQKRKHRMPQQPYKVLPAALLKDDFYLNLLDYAETGHIGVGLQSALFIWSGCATKVTRVHEFRSEADSLCSIKFMPGSNRVALGLNRGEIAIFDLQRQKMESYF